MAYADIQTKKFLNSVGVGHLWEKIRERYDSKLDEVVAGNDSILVNNDNQIQVAISSDAGNMLQLKTTGNKGLYVAAASSDSYAIERDATSGDYSAVYRLKKYENGSQVGVDAGVAINIPKDMVVQSGQVVTKATSGEWGAAGTYIELTLANATNSLLYIPVDSLVSDLISGSQSGDMVVVDIDGVTHEITATITDGTITLAKLSTDLQNMLTAAQNAAQMYGTTNDTASTMSLHGVKQYASDAYSAIIALTNSEIDSAIAAANIDLDS